MDEYSTNLRLIGLTYTSYIIKKNSYTKSYDVTEKIIGGYALFFSGISKNCY